MEEQKTFYCYFNNQEFCLPELIIQESSFNDKSFSDKNGLVAKIDDRKVQAFIHGRMCAIAHFDYQNKKKELNSYLNNPENLRRIREKLLSQLNKQDHSNSISYDGKMLYEEAYRWVMQEIQPVLNKIDKTESIMKEFPGYDEVKINEQIMIEKKAFMSTVETLANCFAVEISRYSDSKNWCSIS